MQYWGFNTVNKVDELKQAHLYDVYWRLFMELIL